MKYESEYKKAKNKKEFVEILITIGVKKETAKRRFYDLKKSFSNQKIVQAVLMEDYKNHNSQKPSRTKLLLYKDMKRFNVKITNELLQKYGFTIEEMNWLIRNDRMV